MHVDDLSSITLFDGLSRVQLAQLIEGGTEVRVEPGVDLFRQGEHADFWWVLVEGAVDLVRRVGREETLVGRLDAPGRWAGGFRAWDEQGVYLATGRGSVSGRMLRVPAEVLRELANDWFPLGAHLIRGLYGTARYIESTARQRESLVTLGRLAAGLAHEINNPTAAAVRAVDALETACRTLLASLTRLAHGDISAQQFTALDRGTGARPRHRAAHRRGAPRWHDHHRLSTGSDGAARRRPRSPADRGAVLIHYAVVSRFCHGPCSGTGPSASSTPSANK
jgi:CRP-like cAMP-binding protein